MVNSKVKIVWNSKTTATAADESNRESRVKWMDDAKTRAQSYKSKPLILNGCDPMKFMQTIKPEEVKPYMTVYYDKFKDSKSSVGVKTKGKRRNLTKRPDTTELPPVLSHQHSRA